LGLLRTRHLTFTQELVETANQSRGKFEWRESGPDHFFHAEAYCKLAELIDPNVIQYYSDRVDEYKDKTRAEIDQEEHLKKTLFPVLSTGERKALEKGEIKPQDSKELKDMSVIDAESFLRNVFHHNEEFLARKK